MHSVHTARKTRRLGTFDAVVYVISALVGLITLYPFVYMISLSISDHQMVLNGEIHLLPHGFNIAAYQVFFADHTIWRAYLNTIIIAAGNTIMGLFVNSMAGYALSMSFFRWRRSITVFLLFAMFFGGGLIPFYILLSKLKMVNNYWGLIVPYALSQWYIMIFRTFFSNDIPESLRESALLDGASELQIFRRIVLPLSKPVFATIAMYYIVSNWNNYFMPMLLLDKSELFPLQVVLQHKLSVSNAQKMDGALNFDFYSTVPVQSTRAAAILASSLPILCIYPFIQKCFVKGVMIGAVKG